MKRLVATIAVGAFLAAAASAQHTIIMNGSVAVSPGFWWQQFSIGRGGGSVVGQFRTQGGSQNDIFAYIVAHGELENMTNRNDFRHFYQSGRRTKEDVNVRLGPGTYFFVFYNDAWISPKTVYGSLTAVSDFVPERVQDMASGTRCQLWNNAGRSVPLRRNCRTRNCAADRRTIVRYVANGTRAQLAYAQNVPADTFTWEMVNVARKAYYVPSYMIACR